MDLTFHIKRLYSSIADQRGNFGDGAEWDAGDPCELLTSLTLSEAHTEGLGVVILHYLTTAIDNMDFESAQKERRPWLDEILGSSQLTRNLLIREELARFTQADCEADFVESLAPVYREIVLPKDRIKGSTTNVS